MTSVFSWQKFCYPLPYFLLYSKAKLACYSRYLLTSYFCIQILYDEKNVFVCVCVLVLEVLVGLHRTFSFLGISIWAIDLDYCDVEWFDLEMN